MCPDGRLADLLPASLGRNSNHGSVCAVVGFQRINTGLCVWLIWRSFKEDAVSEMESGKNIAASQIKGRGVKVGGTV